jgi:hypothetical protein
VHLVFFLHITTGPDNTNNALALAFGVLIVGLVIAGSLWIMYHLNSNMEMNMESQASRAPSIGSVDCIAGPRVEASGTRRVCLAREMAMFRKNCRKRIDGGLGICVGKDQQAGVTVARGQLCRYAGRCEQCAHFSGRRIGLQ